MVNGLIGITGQNVQLVVVMVPVIVNDLVLIHYQITMENIVMVMILRLKAAFWNHVEVRKLFWYDLYAYININFINNKQFRDMTTIHM